MTLALFVIGPLAGSFDEDGDGYPDVPVVVSAAIFHAGALPAQADCTSPDVHDLATCTQSGVQTSNTADDKNHSTSPEGRAVLLSSCLLRC